MGRRLIDLGSAQYACVIIVRTLPHCQGRAASMLMMLCDKPKGYIIDAAD